MYLLSMPEVTSESSHKLLTYANCYLFKQQMPSGLSQVLKYDAVGNLMATTPYHLIDAQALAQGQSQLEHKILQHDF